MGLRVFITIHPSFILRIHEPADKEAERERFLQDMKQVKAEAVCARSECGQRDATGSISP